MAQTSDTLIPNSDVEDSVIWLPSPTGSYSIRSTWEAVRTKYLEKQWTKVVWFKRNVPRWAFILWLAFLQRLSTKGRIASWGDIWGIGLPLCSVVNESHQHLFFERPFSRSVWQEVWSRSFRDGISYKLSEIMDGLCSM